MGEKMAIGHLVLVLLHGLQIAHKIYVNSI